MPVRAFGKLGSLTAFVYGFRNFRADPPIIPHLIDAEIYIRYFSEQGVRNIMAAMAICIWVPSSKAPDALLLSVLMFGTQW